MILRGLDDNCIAADVIGNRPYVQHSGTFNLWRRLFSIKIAFGMGVSKAQGHTLKRVEKYPPSPSLCDIFLDPLYLTTLLLRGLKCIDSL